MNSEQLLHAPYLDIVFDGRNKTYGSYELRKNYDRRLLQSAGFMLMLLLITSSYLLLNKPFITAPTTYKTNERVLEPLKPNIHIVPDKPAAASTNRPVDNTPPPAAKTRISVPTRISPDHLVTTTITPVDSAAPIGPRNDNDGMVNGSVGSPPNTSAGGTTGDAPLTNHPNVPKNFVFVEHMPEFPGGEAALKSWLSAHLNYPQAARDADKEGRVFVQFVIDEQGNITEVVALRGFGYGSESEAIRVVKAMPNWKPGIQNGRKVRVLYNLPISFRLD